MKKADIRIESDPEHIKLLKGLAHPVRLELLGILSYRDLSPKTFARMRREPVSNLSYHFRTLEELGCIELARERPIRGSVEHIYRRIKRVVFSERDWLIMPDEERQIVASSILRDFVGRMTQALQAGTFTSRPDVHITWRPVIVDEEGWTELMGILATSAEEAEKAELRAFKRMQTSGEESIEATLGLAGFESPKTIHTDNELGDNVEQG